MSTITHYDYRPSLDQQYQRAWHNYYEYPLNPQTAVLNTDTQMISVFISSHVTKEVIDLMPNLTTIMCRSAGTDHVDVAYAQSKWINVARVPWYGPHVIATHALSLLLYGVRSTEASLTQTRQGTYSYTQNTIRDLKWMKVWLIGTGKIGQAIGKLCKAFETELYAYDPYPNEQRAAEYSCSYISFDQLISQSDIIILACNATEDNRHLINESVIKQMKSWVYLINIARGSLIDEQALITYADKFAFIWLDAIQDESTIGLSKFLSLTNCAITPHIAYLADSTVATIWEETYKIIP